MTIFEGKEGRTRPNPYGKFKKSCEIPDSEVQDMPVGAALKVSASDAIPGELTVPVFLAPRNREENKMKRRALHKLLSLLCLLALLSQGCSVEAQQPGPRPGTRLIVWLDLSSSVSGEQRTAWLQEAKKIIAQLAATDSIFVFGIHEATLGAGPLYIGHMPALRTNASLHERLQVHAAQHKVREEAAEAIKQALSGKANAKQTDLFGALDRIRPDDKGRPTVHYFFSDMEHATAELNMEVTPLAKNMQSLVNNVVKRHGWHSNHLAETRVNCILPGARGRSKVNDRLVLERFWGDLFRTVGAKLENFETYLKTS